MSCSSRMVDCCCHNVEMKVQQCSVAVKIQFRGSLLVIVTQNELQLKLTLS